MPVDLEIVRELALSMDDVEECTSYGTPAFKVSGKLFARLHQDGETLIVHMNIDQRDDLIAVEPDVSVQYAQVAIDENAVPNALERRQPAGSGNQSCQHAHLEAGWQPALQRAHPVHIERVQPDKFYITDHYRDYQWILIRMSQVSTDEVGRLLKAARDSRSPQKRKKTRA